MDDGAGPPMPRELCMATPALDVSSIDFSLCDCVCMMCMRPAEGLGAEGRHPAHVASQRFPCVAGSFYLEPPDCVYKVHLFPHVFPTPTPVHLYADENEKKEKEAPTRPTSHAASYPIQN